MEEGGEGAKPPSPPPLSSAIAPPPDPSLSDAIEDSIGENEEDHEPEVVSSGDGTLSDELRAQIVRQVEYYFSDENLPTDKFLLKYVKKNGRGSVPIGVIASFRKMKKLVKDPSLIEAALRTSSKLVVSEDGKKVRRLNPLPIIVERKDDKLRTVVVENLPENYSEESIRQTFGEIGKIVKISIEDPQAAEGSHSRKEVYMIRSKVHAFVEYDSVEAADKAVATLNDEKDWRRGMRVKHLSKRTGFNNFTEKNKEAEGGDIGSEKDDKEEEHAKGRKHNNRNRRKGHVPKSSNEQGHGRGTVGSNSEFANKPLPGPRMPDGTRGFTMGRGKPVHSDQKPNMPDP